jgi:hypothetical protein
MENEHGNNATVKWYEREPPVEAITPCGEIRYYPEAKKAQFSLAKYSDDDGVVHFGKTVTLHVDKLAAFPEVKAVLTAIIENL